MLLTKEGIFENIPIETYHQSPGFSNSQLKYFMKNTQGQTPRDFFLKTFKKTANMILGDRVHLFTLQPELWGELYYVYDNPHKLSSTSGKELLAKALVDADGRELLEKREEEEIRAISLALTSHPVFSRILEPRIENSVMWQCDKTGISFRSRPDIFSEKQRIIVDIKTTNDASPSGFWKKIRDFGYYTQAAMAIDGLKKTLNCSDDFTFILLAVETKEPYHCVAYYISQDAIEKGREHYKNAAIFATDCVKNDYYPAYLVYDEFGVAIDPSKVVAPIHGQIYD